MLPGASTAGGADAGRGGGRRVQQLPERRGAIQGQVDEGADDQDHGHGAQDVHPVTRILRLRLGLRGGTRRPRRRSLRLAGIADDRPQLVAWLRRRGHAALPRGGAMMRSFPMTEIIAVASSKGGVGKTTTSFSLAAAAASEGSV